MSKKIYNNPFKTIEMLKNENDTLNKLYKQALLKMKKIQKDYESMYSQFVNENMIRENIIKNNYIKYQELLEQHFQKEENNYIEEIKNLKLQMKEKEKIINVLQNNNTLLNDKLAKNELIFNLKEKEYQKQLFNKDRLLMKSSDIVNKNSHEVMEDIKKLKEEIKYFQNKANNNSNIYNKKINNINNDNINNFNYFNNEYKRQQQIKKSLSSNNFHDSNYYMDFNSKNNCFESFNNFENTKMGSFNLKQNFPYPFKNKASNNSNEIHKLKARIINLINIIKQKEREINFLKNSKQNLYMNNKTQNFDNFSNSTYINSINNNYRNINSEQKCIKRCNSQTSGQIRKNKKNKFNLCLVDSNIINKPIKKNVISYKNKTKT